MSELRKFVAPEFLYGPGALETAGQYARNLGVHRLLVVTDPGVMAAGWTGKVTASLEAEGLEAVVYSQVSPNPRAEEVMAGVEVFERERCDAIVAVGGGSPLDCAKGIGIAHSNGCHVLEFEGIDNVEVPGPPLICIPTTAGTAADLSQFCIITNRTQRTKIAIISKTVIPDVALIDPVTTTTMDRYLTACTGMDAMVHAVEAFVSSAHSPLTDLHALEAIRLINGNLLAVLDNLEDVEIRDKVMRGSLEAGLAFSNASLGAVHAMAHSLGGFLDLPHGECNSILLDHVMAFNYDHAEDRFGAIGQTLGLHMDGLPTGERRRVVLRHIAELKRNAGIFHTLSERGVRAADVPDLARNAMHDACMVTNPRQPIQRDVEVIYEEAL